MKLFTSVQIYKPCPPFSLRVMLSLFLLVFTALAQTRAEYVPNEDFVPVWNGSGSGAEPAEGPDCSDFDGDQLVGWLETYYGTDFWNSDTDGDGMPDGWEIGNSLNPRSGSDVYGDADNDSIPNVEEYRHSTSPTSWDNYLSVMGQAPPESDGDAMPDSWEMTNGLSPYDAGDIADDPDGDFILNIEEYQHGSNPQAWDDFWTVMGYPIDPYALNRQNDGTERDADWDSDGRSNLDELTYYDCDPRISDNSEAPALPESEPEEQLSSSDPDPANEHTASEDEIIMVTGVGISSWSEYQYFNVYPGDWVTVQVFGSASVYYGLSDEFGPPPGYEWAGPEESNGGEQTELKDRDYELSSLPSLSRWLRWESLHPWKRQAVKKK